MSPGFGYNSMSEARTKWVRADSRAIFRPTFTGYVKLLAENKEKNISSIFFFQNLFQTQNVYKQISQIAEYS